MDILKMSASASVLILFAVCARMLVKSKIPRDVVNVLWGIACCKLLVPFSVAPPFGKLLESVMPAGSRYSHGNGSGIMTIPSGVLAASRKTVPMTYDVLPAIWLIGMVCFFFYFLVTYVRSTRTFRTALPAEDIDGIFDAVLRQFGRHERVSVKVSDRIASPLTYGVLNPVIVLPKGTDGRSADSLYYVLAHEMSHIKRRDCARKICLAAALACHWFNPFVWWMYDLANRDIELACDEKVLRSIGRGRRSAYAGMLVDWAAGQSEGNRLASHLSENKMEERIMNIMKYKKITVAGMAASLALVAGAAVVYAASPSGTTVQGTDALTGNIALTDKADMAVMADETGNVTVTMDGREGAGRTDTHSQDDTEGRAKDQSDPTLGGIFALYTPEEFAEVVERVRRYSDGTAEDIRHMEEDLERLRADDGKGEFVIYKGAFEKNYETGDGAMISEAIDPTVIMAPEQMDRTFTAEEYRQAIESVSHYMDEAVADGRATPEQKDRIVQKMRENLSNLDS